MKMSEVAANEKNIFINHYYHDNFRFLTSTCRCRNLGHSSEMQNDALLYREGLKY